MLATRCWSWQTEPASSIQHPVSSIQYPINLMSESFGMIFIAFFDSGRVWEKWSDLAFNDFHSTFGFGIWLNWDNNLIIRLDVGHSREETFFPFLRLNTAF